MTLLFVHIRTLLAFCLLYADPGHASLQPPHPTPTTRTASPSSSPPSATSRLTSASASAPPRTRPIPSPPPTAPATRCARTTAARRAATCAAPTATSPSASASPRGEPSTAAGCRMGRPSPTGPLLSTLLIFVPSSCLLPPFLLMSVEYRISLEDC